MTENEEQLTHINQAGEANMVDVGGKSDTQRVAVAQSIVTMQPATLAAIKNNDVAKGEVLAVARVAGIQAAKRCSELIPLCHPLALNKVKIDFAFVDETSIRIEAMCSVTGKTGVEMEALTAASVSALTIYDMAKALDKGITISNTCLLLKSGGKSGEYVRPSGEPEFARGSLSGATTE